MGEVGNYIHGKSLCTKLKYFTSFVEGHFQDIDFHTEGKASQDKTTTSIKKQSHIQILYFLKFLSNFALWLKYCNTEIPSHAYWFCFVHFIYIPSLLLVEGHQLMLQS